MDQPPLPKPAPAPARPPSPKPLIITLMVVAFFGGSCTVQQIFAPPQEIPGSPEELAAEARTRGLVPGNQTPEETDRLLRALYPVLAEQAQMTRRFRPFQNAFGVALALGYAFVLVFGMRALVFMPGAARGLSMASLFVAPARAAVAAVEVAIARNLGPAFREMAQRLGEQQAMPKDARPEDIERAVRIAADIFAGGAVALNAGVALVVCALFTWGWRYFQHPDVLAFFDQQAARWRSQ